MVADVSILLSRIGLSWFWCIRLYITYTLMEFLFGLDQSNVCRDIEKIESLIRECLPIPQKLYNVTRRLKTKEEVEQYFPGFMAFTDCSRTADTPT